MRLYHISCFNDNRPDSEKDKEMPTVRIRDIPKQCNHPEHFPHKEEFEPGVYRHTCPECFKEKEFTIWCKGDYAEYIIKPAGIDSTAAWI